MPAIAIEAVPDAPAVEVVDGRITIGGRTLLLPEGRWYYVGGELSIVIGAPPFLSNALIDTAHLVQIDRGVFAQALSVSMLRSPLAVKGWSRATCSGPETYYIDEQEGLPDLPDCVAIDGVGAPAFDRYLRTHAGKIADWLQEHRVRAPETTIGVLYLRGSPSNFGRVMLVVPAEHFDSDANAAAWAGSLRTALKPLFENRQAEGTLPALPALAAPRHVEDGTAPPAASASPSH